jgi:hypothetical protein
LLAGNAGELLALADAISAQFGEGRIFSLLHPLEIEAA